MLNSLIIQDFVIVEQLDLNFEQGMSVLSGETGAGKSILIDALSLVLGARADVNMIRHNCNKANVTALFDTNSQTNQILQDQAIDPDEQLCIRRVVEASGKSKAFVNGTAVSVSVLKQLASSLVNIHGQHAFQTITKPLEQLKLIDHFGKHKPLTEEVEITFKAWSNLKKELLSAENNEANRETKLEALNWKFEQLNEIDPKAGQWEALNQQFDKLSHGADLIEGSQTAIDQLSQNDHSILDQLNAIIQKLEHLARTDQELSPVCSNLKDSEVLIRETTYELNSYSKKLALDPVLLNNLEKQISNWHDTARKIKVPPEQLPEEFDNTQKEIEALQTYLNTEELKKQVEQAKADYDKAAKQLTQQRTQQADRLSKLVSESLQTLNMKGGQFEIRLAHSEPSKNGSDTAEFWVAGHPGVPLQPLAKVASGGELSRISLAITVNTTETETVPCLVFDEVDSGIGGEVANRIGCYLRQLAQHKQVFCVTHLAQVAAYAHHHFQISKHINAGTARTHIQALSHDSRIIEIARMLGGSNSDLSKQTAQEMIETATN